MGKLVDFRGRPILGDQLTFNPTLNLWSTYHRPAFESALDETTAHYAYGDGSVELVSDENRFVTFFEQNTPGPSKWLQAWAVRE